MDEYQSCERLFASRRTQYLEIILILKRVVRREQTVYPSVHLRYPFAKRGYHVAHYNFDQSAHIFRNERTCGARPTLSQRHEWTGTHKSGRGVS